MSETPNDYEAIDAELEKETHRENELLDRLSQEPVVEVTGVIDSNGPQFSSNSWEKLSKVEFTLSAWKIDGGPLRLEPLLIRKKVHGAYFRKLAETIYPQNLIHARIHFLEENDTGVPQAQMVEWISNDFEDEELEAELDKLLAASSIEHPEWGAFRFDGMRGCFENEIDWLGQDVIMTIVCLPAFSGEDKTAEEEDEYDEFAEIDLAKIMDSEELKRLLALASELYHNKTDWDRRVKQFAYKQMFPPEFAPWDGEQLREEISLDEFCDGTEIMEITLYGQESLAFQLYNELVSDAGDFFVICTASEGPCWLDSDLPEDTSPPNAIYIG